MKSLLKTLILTLCGLLSVSFAAAQAECPEDTYVIFASGGAYSINDPDAEPLTLVSDISVYLPEVGSVDGDNPFWMDYSSTTDMVAFTDGTSVFLLDGNDEAPRQLILNDTAEHDYLEFEALSWSPDGQSLAVAVLENLSPYDLPSRMVILIYDLENDLWHEVIEVMYEEVGLLTYLETLRWSSDGSAIAFALDTIIQIRFFTTHYFDTACFNEDVCEHSEILMRPVNNEDGYPEDRYAPDWSPDGSRLGFICGDDLCIFDRENVQVERVEELDIVDEFMWLPCGNRILYQHEDESFVMRDLDSGEENTFPITLRTGTVIQLHDVLALVPMPDAAFLFESSGA